jgi:hypothetical protein
LFHDRTAGAPLVDRSGAPIEPRLQHLHRFGVGLVLAALLLAGHGDAGGQMRQAHCGVGLVDVLSAGI